MPRAAIDELARSSRRTVRATRPASRAVRFSGSARTPFCHILARSTLDFACPRELQCQPARPRRIRELPMLQGRLKGRPSMSIHHRYTPTQAEALVPILRSIANEIVERTAAIERLEKILDTSP